MKNYTASTVTLSTTLTNALAANRPGVLFGDCDITCKAGGQIFGFYCMTFDVTRLGPGLPARQFRAATVSLDVAYEDRATITRAKAGLNTLMGARFDESESLFQRRSPEEIWAAASEGNAGNATHGFFFAGPCNSGDKGDVTPVRPLLKAIANAKGCIVEGALTTGPMPAGPHRTSMFDDAPGRFDCALILSGGKDRLDGLIKRCSKILRAFEKRAQKRGCLACVVDLQVAVVSESGERTFFNGLLE